jgi:hypothetical protein
VDMDTGAQADCVSNGWAEEMQLKPYKKPYPRTLGVVGAQTTQTQGAYWVRYTMTDSQGVTREYLRPFLAVKRDPDESPLLIGELGLETMRIDLSLRTREEGGPTWKYNLNLKSFVKHETTKKFRKRLRKSPKVYALVEINHLIQGPSTTGQGLPPQLDSFLDVFSAT